MDANYTNWKFELIELEKNDTNSTTAESLPKYFEAVHIFIQVLVIVIQLIIMVSMGCIISFEEILNHIKQPISIIIALISQFIALPLFSFGIIVLLKLSPATSLAALILACSPGGSVSNLYTYFCDGDVPLSITLTTVSTALAFGLMPLNLWVYARRWTDNQQTLTIPYGSIVITLTLIIIPLAIGMLLKKYYPKVAVIINKIGSVFSITFILLFLSLEILLYPKLFVVWKSWLVAVAISIGGFFLGLLMSIISRRPSKHLKAILIETGIKSVSLVVSVILTSFPENFHSKMTPIPTMNGVVAFVAGICIAMSVKLAKYVKKRS